MKIQIIEPMVGDSFSWIPGDIVEVDQADGLRLVQAGRALSLSADEAPTGETPESKAKAKREKR